MLLSAAGGSRAWLSAGTLLALSRQARSSPPNGRGGARAQSPGHDVVVRHTSPLPAIRDTGRGVLARRIGDLKDFLGQQISALFSRARTCRKSGRSRSAGENVYFPTVKNNSLG